MRKLLFAAILLPAIAFCEALRQNGPGLVSPGNGGTGTGTAFTAGSVVFSGASGVYAQDNANLFFDDSNNRLGVGVATPATLLDVNGVSQFGSTAKSTFTAAGALTLAQGAALTLSVGTGGSNGLGCSYIGYADFLGNASASMAVSASTTTTTANVALYFATMTVNANTLAANGSYLELECAGSIAAGSANQKNMEFAANTSTIISFDGLVATTPTAGITGVRQRATLTRTGASTQAWMSFEEIGTNLGRPSAGTTALTDTSAITIACTGTTNASATGDLSFLYFKVWACGGPS